MVAGHINTPRLAESILAERKADLICMCRALICDPDLPNKARQGRTKAIRRCLYDNTCTDTIIRGVPGAALVCLMNPEVGREYAPEPKAKRARRVLVLGGSPAGLEAARTARLRGHTVALFEEKERLGGRWSWMIDPYVVDRRKLLEALGVEIRLGTPATPQVVAKWSPEVVLATRGLKSLSLDMPGLDSVPWAQAEDVFAKKVEPEGKVVVVGGGNVGLEAAEFLAKSGCRVCIVEQGWPGRGIATIMRAHYFARMAERGVEIFSKVKIVGIKHGGMKLVAESGEKRSLALDWLVSALPTAVDQRPVAWLEEMPLEMIYLNPAQSPRQWAEAMLEGTSAARGI